MKDFAKEIGDNLHNQSYVLNYFLEKIFNTLSQFNLQFYTFRESDLKIDKFLDVIPDLLVEKDEAIWFKYKNKNKVFVKSNGSFSYRCSDLVYHLNKLSRGYDLVIDIFGSDHHETAQDIKEGLEILAIDTSKLKIVINQMVIFKNDGEKYKPSKRQGNSIFLEELINDIGVPNIMFFFGLKEPNQHIQIDLSEIKSNKLDNRLNYLFYTYARFFKIIDQNDGYNLEDYDNIEIGIEERKVLIQLLKFGAVLDKSIEQLKPNFIIQYLQELAKILNNYYQKIRIIKSDDYIGTTLKIHLCYLAIDIMRNIFLKILGFEPPTEFYLDEKIKLI